MRRPKLIRQKPYVLSHIQILAYNAYTYTETHTCMHRKIHMWEYMSIKPKTLEESKREGKNRC